jgi:hypothetical protein
MEPADDTALQNGQRRERRISIHPVFMGSSHTNRKGVEGLRQQQSDSAALPDAVID